jgi:hypothetical protein
MYFDALLLGKFIFSIVISSWGIELFIIIKHPSLSLVTFCCFKFYLLCYLYNYSSFFVVAISMMYIVLILLLICWYL